MGINQFYKNRALNSLEGNWSKGIIATLIVVLLTGFLGSAITTPFRDAPGTGMSVQGVWTLLCLPLTWGGAVYFLNLIRREDLSYERLFDGYKDFVRIFLAEFLVSLCVLIGCILLIVPGIIVGLMLSQTAFILKDDKNISAADAMALSMKMMNGHKMEYFLLYLSFIGWFILCLLTLGLGFLVLQPYLYSTLAHYYEDLK